MEAELFDLPGLGTGERGREEGSGGERAGKNRCGNDRGEEDGGGRWEGKGFLSFPFFLLWHFILKRVRIH